MKYIIGMDGGGTNTVCAIADIEGNVLYKCSGGPSNFLIKGTEVISQNIFSLIENCVSKLRIKYSEIKIIVIGVTGGGRREDADHLRQSIIALSNNKGIEFEKILVESDALIALEGAFSGRPGSILISGTGSIMFGKDDKEKIYRVGGFGRIIGDGGSGYSIGRKGLNAMSKQFDGRDEFTEISKLMYDNFNITSAEILISEVYRNNFDVASVAPIVISAAENNDKIALRIIEEEAEELLLHIESMLKKINQPVMNLAFIGGIISRDNIFSRTLKQKISYRVPHVNILEPENSPEIGAIIIGKNLISA